MNEFKATANGKYENKISKNSQGEILLNDEKVGLDVLFKSDNEIHILKDGKSYTAELLHLDHDKKEMSLLVNRNKYNISIKDKYDQLLDSLGFSAQLNAANADLKAPMPGLVLSVNVEVGQEVKEGEAILILEAMKMENVLKASADGVVKSIEVEKGNAVEKNQLLVAFE